MNVYFDEDDRDAPLEQDLEDDPENDTIQCPSCGYDVFENAERCPHCGDWIVTRGATGRLHWIWIVGAALALAAMIAVSIR